MSMKLEDVIENIGLGLTHVRFVVSGGGVWLADGIELTLLSSVAKSVGAEFHVGPFLRGFLVTIVYFGVACGNMLSGPLGDRFGRRYIILTSYMGIFLFSVVSSETPTYLWLAIVRIFVGASFGLGQPVWNSLVTEVTPSFWRPVTNAVSQSLFTVGEIYCYLIVWLDDPSMLHLNWRLLIQEGAFPSFIFFVIALIWLLESPRFLKSSGSVPAAQEVLMVMASDNGKPELPVDFQADDSEAENQSRHPPGTEFGVIFDTDWKVTTYIMMYSCFVMNFVYYGSLYAFPQILPEVSGTGGLSPALSLMIGACWEFPGYVIAAIAALMYSRKPVIKAYLLLTILSAALFAIGISMAQKGIGDFMWHCGFYGMKCFVTIGYVVVYVYLGEVYPTDLRVSGAAAAFACGRIGAMLSSIGYEVLTWMSNSFATFFIVSAVLCFLNLCIIDFLPHETFKHGLLQGKSYGSMRDSSLSVSEAVNSEA